MTKWSGLAPAVNAHLHRWHRVEEESKRIDAIHDRSGSEISIPIAQFPVTAGWSVFARSWGIPQADGTVVAPEVIAEAATINGREQFNYSKATASNGYALMDIERRVLSHAETVYVSEEIVDRITYAAAQMEPEPLYHTDMFTPYGVLVLEKPLHIPDYHPQKGELVDYLHVAMRALAWGPQTVHGEVAGEMVGHPGTIMISYTTNMDWRDTYARELVWAVNRGLVTPADAHLPEDVELPIHLEDYAFAFSHGNGLGRDTFAPMDVMPWAFGRPWVSRDRPVYESGTVDSAVAYVRRWFLTLMRFCWQRLLVPEHPQFSKKLNRTVTLEYKRPRHEYSVLRLRRTNDSSEPTGTGQKLSYRVKTRGHWRRVFVPTLGTARNEDGSFNDDSHRLTWIEAYWRGPEGAPEGPEHKATVIVR